jgi:hypothetical protein
MTGLAGVLGDLHPRIPGGAGDGVGQGPGPLVDDLRAVVAEEQ